MGNCSLHLQFGKCFHAVVSPSSFRATLASVCMTSPSRYMYFLHTSVPNLFVCFICIKSRRIFGKEIHLLQMKISNQLLFAFYPQKKMFEEDALSSENKLMKRFLQQSKNDQIRISVFKWFRLRSYFLIQYHLQDILYLICDSLRAIYH